MTQQEQQERREPLDETYVPQPRSGEHDEDAVVGTAPAPNQQDAEAGAEESYPARTYVSESADTDTDSDADSDAEDRRWAAEHATQLRAGAVDTDEADETQAVEVEDQQDQQDPGEDELAESRPGGVDVAAVGALWADGSADGLRERWRELQLRFIDDPRSVADEADRLVDEAVGSVTESLQRQRRELAAWQNQEEDTERLRAAVRGYRDFLDRLLGL
ncbi:hypothetical protein [Dactylosporangium sp. CA-092794]|uniref:hypothetical protein n=1 Tax=Dactylosporangium sp. CA-092794 TaxID=3239929 RepID=UPI003D8FBDB6